MKSFRTFFMKANGALDTSDGSGFLAQGASFVSGWDGFDVMVVAVKSDVGIGGSVGSRAHLSWIFSFQQSSHNTDAKSKVIKPAVSINNAKVNTPCCCDRHVQRVDEERPPPFLYLDCRPIIRHITIQNVDTTHKAVIVLDHARLFHFNPDFLFPTPTRGFSTDAILPNEVKVSGDANGCVVIPLDGSNTPGAAGSHGSARFFLENFSLRKRTAFKTVFANCSGCSKS